LTDAGVFCWRNNSTGLFDAQRGTFRRKGRFEMLGVSDIIGIHHGRFLAIEVKRKGGKLTPAQQVFIQEVSLRDGMAAVVFSFEDFKDWWETNLKAMFDEKYEMKNPKLK
jgi:hypothetical protein